MRSRLELQQMPLGVAWHPYFVNWCINQPFVGIVTNGALCDTGTVCELANGHYLAIHGLLLCTKYK
jgi:hypothetical protein